jgi:hypothetical protein
MRGFLHLATTATLVAVGGLAVLALVWSLLKPEFTHHEVQKSATALVWLALTGLYASVHRRTSLHWLGLPLYVGSCAVALFLLPPWINGVYKDFAPSSPEEAVLSYWHGLAALAVSGMASVGAWGVVAWLSARSTATRCTAS